MDLNSLTIESAKAAVAEQRITAEALVQQFYNKIKSDDAQIHAYPTSSKARARQQPRRIDRMARVGDPLPPLAGVPVGIKDVLVTKDVRSTAGSKILENYIPPYDCTAVVRLEA